MYLIKSISAVTNYNSSSCFKYVQYTNFKFAVRKEQFVKVLENANLIIDRILHHTQKK